MKSKPSSTHLMPTDMTAGVLLTRYGSIDLPNRGMLTFPCFVEELSPLAVIIRIGLLEWYPKSSGSSCVETKS